MKSLKVLSLLAIILLGCAKKEVAPSITKLNSPTESLLQAISIVSEDIAWISGHQAYLILTKDQGNSWEIFQFEEIDTLQFRDVYGISSDKAIVMSAGPGSQSRIMTFEDGSWTQNFIMEDSLGFLDCIDFWDEKNGIAYGDAIDDYPYILLTTDGGESWKRAPTSKMPKAGNGEGGFAASGTCVTTGPGGAAWIATGAGGNCRILRTEDYGNSWSVADSPLIKGDAAGNTSISFDREVGFVTGGDLLQSDDYTDNTAFSLDAGKTWKLSSKPETTGAFYGGAISTINDVSHTFACGPNGVDYTNNFGETWKTVDTLNYWAVALKGNIGYVSGRDGRILKISLQ